MMWLMIIMLFGGFFVMVVAQLWIVVLAFRNGDVIRGVFSLLLTPVAVFLAMGTRSSKRPLILFGIGLTMFLAGQVCAYWQR